METNPEVTRTPYTCFLALALRSSLFREGIEESG